MKKYLKKMSMTKVVNMLIPLTLIVSMLIPLTVSADTGEWEPPSNTETYYDDLPLPMGNGAGYNIEFTETQVDDIKTYLEGYGVPTGNIHYIIFNEATTTTTYSVLVFYNAPAEYPTNPTCTLYSGNDLSDYVIRMEGFCGQYYFDDLQLRAGSGFGARFTTVDMNTLNFLNESATGDYSLKTGNLYHYPLYSKFEGGIYDTSTNDQLFTTEGTTPPPTTTWDFTHAKGGYESAYQDIGDLDEIDNTPPSDTTSNSAWYQKILNAIKQSGKNFIAGTLLIVQEIQNGINKITGLIEQIIAFWGRAKDKIEDIAEDLHTIKEKLTEENTPTEIANAWETGYNSTVFYGMEQNITSARQEFSRLGQGGDNSDLNLGRWKITHKQNSISIIGEIDYPEIMGGVTKEHEMSFRWYQQIKTWFIPVLNAFLVLGFTLHLIRQFPAFINGQGTDLRSKIEK